MKEIMELDAFLKDKGIEDAADVPMSGYTTFRIGGPCSRMVWPSSEEQIASVLSFCREKGIPVYIVGNGSNLLVSDSGIDGVVVQLGKRFSDVRLEEDGRTIVCQAGAALFRVCQFAEENGLTGIEFAYGIPGSVGGAVYMNAGAYGGEMKDVVKSCRHLDPEGNPGTLSGEDLGFSYRHSAYCGRNDCVTEVRFELLPGDRDAISAAMKDYAQRRRSKQPLDLPSAGSTFKRPAGGYASALIDQCGLKGLSCGGAKVSEKHAGFIVNTGGATCADVVELIERVAEEVREKTGFVLEPEVKMLP